MIFISHDDTYKIFNILINNFIIFSYIILYIVHKKKIDLPSKYPLQRFFRPVKLWLNVISIRQHRSITVAFFPSTFTLPIKFRHDSIFQNLSHSTHPPRKAHTHYAHLKSRDFLCVIRECTWKACRRKQNNTGYFSPTYGGLHFFSLLTKTRWKENVLRVLLCIYIYILYICVARRRSLVNFHEIKRKRARPKIDSVY